jgi:hypothetical protein
MNKANLIALTRSTKFRILAAAVTSLVGGAAGGYVIATKKLEGKYAAISEDEINEARHYYRELYSTLQKPASPQELVTQIRAEEALQTYKGHPVLHGLEDVLGTVESVEQTDEGVEISGTLTEEGAEVVRNIFDDADNDLPEDEMPDADPENPYIITADEYMEGELGYEQTTLSYFKGDDVLVDTREVPIEDTDATVGDDNLTKFGLGSRDKNVLYVRNQRIETDFEIVQSAGEYAEEVLGLQHSDEPRVRRFRSYDD